MWPALLTVLAVAVCIGMLVVAHRIEPHWVSKDHRRFLTTSEEVDPLGTVIGRRKEVKGLIADDGRIVLRHRAVMRSSSVVYAIQAKSPRPPAGKALYVLRPIPASEDGALTVLRVPASSELVGLLDALGTDGGPSADTSEAYDEPDTTATSSAGLDGAPPPDEVSAPPPDP